MLRIEGLGPKRVKLLYDTLGIKSIEALENAALADALSSVAGFGKKTQENILKGIAAVRSRGGRKLYPAALHAAEEILENLKKEPGFGAGEITGSIRRKRETIGDIDIVVSAAEENHTRLMGVFLSHPQVESVVARGSTKSSAMLRSGIQCDLRIVSTAEYPFALNYSTGSKEHNVELRSRARRLGLSLNEYGFTRLDAQEFKGKARRIPRCRDEASIYAALNLAFVPPELRENMGEIEQAEHGTLPELIEQADIRGTFHCHTTYSDGLATLEQAAAAAMRAGWEYLGVADHSKAAAYAGGLTAADVRRQFREIDALNAGMKLPSPQRNGM